MIEAFFAREPVRWGRRSVGRRPDCLERPVLVLEERGSMHLVRTEHAAIEVEQQLLVPVWRGLLHQGFELHICLYKVADGRSKESAELAKLLTHTGESEQRIEFCRQNLCKAQAFEPYAAF